MKMNQRTSSLSINSVEGMHRGIYKCLVSNLAGTVEHSAELRVNGSLRTTANTRYRHRLRNTFRVAAPFLLPFVLLLLIFIFD